jgi:Fe-S-cluster containining protein
MSRFKRDKVVTNGCSGGCCSNFSLGYSLDDLKLMLEAVNEHRTEFCDSRGLLRRVVADRTLQTMIDMLIPISTVKEDPNGSVNYTELVAEYIKIATEEGKVIDYEHEWFKNFVKEGDEYLKHTFTCKHFDTKKRVCTNYNNRPNMCKSFPNDRPCKYDGCKYDLISNDLLNKAVCCGIKENE